MNKIHSICTLALMLPLCAFAQYDGTPMNKSGDTKKAETAVRTDKYPHSDNDWENFDVLHINRLPSAATFMAYTTKEKAVKNDKSQSEYFQSLNGTWKFQFVPRSDQRPMDFFEKGHDVSGWGNIKVPANWEMEGYGHPFYIGAGYGPATDSRGKQSRRFLQTHIQRPCQLERQANRPPLRRRGLSFLCVGQR